ncbi:MAG: UDP-N-acetylmuramoyl-tripeptide--D-alanyl-D-alanine ligase [Clostridia bacterium]|nr:UDP-N-acetylmuramoyl-tripeptide--D-alanyl-D-alanine ligase [Clostridia bacterium]
MKIGIGRKTIDVKRIAAFCGGRIEGDEALSVGAVRWVCTDSREATEAETLFAVTIGERVDGHNYMRRAYEGGCRLFLCQRIPEDMAGCSYCAIVVPDTIEALGSIARKYSESLGIPAVAVTGSVGKTTTKEMISAVLGQVTSVHKTKANHNSTIGLPMSMLEADGTEGVSVVEMGMSGLGEIDFMSRIVGPQIACITNVGSSHLELLGTRENICRAKLEIVNGMPAGGVLFANGDEPLLRTMRPEGVNVKYVSFADETAEVYITNVHYSAAGSAFDIRVFGETMRGLQVKGIGKPFVWAAAFAVAVAKQKGMDEAQIRRGLLSFENAAMRQNITECCGITMIEDCYNASPESVCAAIDTMRTLAEETGARMVAILGDMRELGEGSAEMYESVGKHYVKNNGKVLITVGELAKNIEKGAVLSGFPEAFAIHFDRYETDEAVRTIGDAACAVLEKGDVLLVKASRAVGAERILAYVKEKTEASAKFGGM